MYIIPIGWLFVVVLMAIVEAFSPNGSVLGALVTLVLYGVLPLSIVLYIMGTPGRKRALRAKEAAERQAFEAVRLEAASVQPDAGGLPPTDPVAPVREVP